MSTRGIEQVDGGQEVRIEDPSEEVTAETGRASGFAVADKKVFINRADRYTALHIARHMSKCKVGGARASEGEGDGEDEGGEDEVEGEEEEEGGQRRPSRVSQKQEAFYKVSATLSTDPKAAARLNFPAYLVPQFKARDKFFNYVLGCDVIIYDLTSDDEALEEAAEFLARLESELEQGDSVLLSTPKICIFVTSLLTWSRTGALNKDESSADTMLSEDDFKRRKPHPDYKALMELEKSVLKLGRIKTKPLTMYVVAAGLTYGAEEGALLHLFKLGWYNEDKLPIYGKSDNILPTIHVQNLATTIQHLIEIKPKTKYILAVDESHDTLKDITKAISKGLSTGNLKRLPADDIYLNRLLTKMDIDMLQLNLNIDAVTVRNDLNFQWVSEGGLVANIKQAVKQFKASHNLKPVRAIILGAPGVGKTTVARQLAQRFRIHHLTIPSIIEDLENEITSFLDRQNKQNENTEEDNDEEEPKEKKKNPEGDEEEEEEDEDVEDAEDDLAESPEDLEAKTAEYEALLAEIRESREASEDGKLDTALLHRIILRRLKSSPSRNQGFILDGFPRTIDEATALLAVGEEDEEEEGEGDEGDEKEEEAENPANEEDKPEGDDDEENKGASVALKSYSKPENIFVLDAPDGFLVDRILNLPEQIVTGTHNTEERFLERLARYRETGGDETPDADTLLSYLDQLELYPRKVDVSQDDSLRMAKTADMIERMMGKARNFGPTQAELDELDKRQTEARLALEEQERMERERHDAAEVDARKKMQDHWVRHREKVILEEQEEMDVRALPLHNYLMTHVMPTLTSALVDCCSVRPDDPIDFLAACLFRSNPQVD